MAIEWDVMFIGMSLLAGIIYFSVYLEHWMHIRTLKKEDDRIRQSIIVFIKNDLEQRLSFIDESLQYNDYKPFFTDMWDAVVLAGKHALLSFDLFQSIQHSYFWMKYYNNELEGNRRNHYDEKVLKDLLEDVRKSIKDSLAKISTDCHPASKKIIRY